MSWFTDIAGKAENLLNKIDQNAASVLKQNEKEDSIDSPLISIESSAENSIMTKSADSLSLSSLKPPAMRKSLSLLNAADYHKEMTNTACKSQSASTSRRNSISSKSSKADGTVISIGGSPRPANGEQSGATVRGATANQDVELAATKIVLNEIKAERDELKLEVESLMEQVKNETSKATIRQLQETCSQMMAEKDKLDAKSVW